MQLIKIFFIASILTIFYSCAAQQNQEKVSDDYLVVKKAIELKDLSNSYLVNEACNESLEYLLKEEYPTFFDMWEYNYFQNLISYSTAKEIFNDKEMEYFYTQLKNSQSWTTYYHSSIIPSGDELEKIRIERLKTTANNINIFYLSSIIYTTSKKYSLIYYSTTDLLLSDTGHSGLLIFKNENGNWQYVTTLFYTFS